MGSLRLEATNDAGMESFFHHWLTAIAGLRDAGGLVSQHVPNSARIFQMDIVLANGQPIQLRFFTERIHTLFAFLALPHHNPRS